MRLAKAFLISAALAVLVASAAPSVADPLSGKLSDSRIAANRLTERLATDRLGGIGEQELRDTAIAKTAIATRKAAGPITVSRRRSEADALREQKTRRVASFR
jgi:hypothetical protein